jgi:hypothetical protein
MTRRPASIPGGLVVELSRGKVLPGAGAEAEPQVLLLPEPVRRPVPDWALRPSATPPG